MKVDEATNLYKTGLMTTVNEPDDNYEPWVLAHKRLFPRNSEVFGLTFMLYSLAILALLVFGGVLYERITTTIETRRNPAPGRIVDLGTHKLHLRTLGSSGPVVVLQSGAGSPGLVWELVAPKVARFARVVIIDRAGYGWSEPGPMPRTSERAAAEMKLALEKAQIEGPYILVGHSFGGLTMRVFAAQYRDLVSGLVLVDATHEDELTDRFPQEHHRGQRALPKMMRLLSVMSTFGVVRLLARMGALGTLHDASKRMDRTTGQLLVSQSIHPAALAASASEMGAIADSYHLARQGGSLGSIPLVVLIHGKPGPVMPGTSPETAATIETLLMAVAQDMSRLSSNGRLVVAHESGHEIHLTEPDLVVDAIRDVATTMT